METQEDQEDQAEPKNNDGEQVSVDDIDSVIPLLDQYVSQDGAVTKINSKINSPTSVLFVMKDVFLLGKKRLRHTVTYNSTES